MMLVNSLLMIVLHSVMYASGFLLFNDCLGSLPSTCLCGESLTTSTPFFLITCKGTQVVNFPAIHNMKITQTSLTLNFCCNRINYVPSNAFSNLEFMKANSTVTIDLQLSELKDIDLHAFRGIESLVTSLNLDNNYLTQIPLAVGTLKNLQMLRIRNNPIATVDPFVTSGIAHSLIFLDLDMDHFQSWPTSFSNLVALQVLKMSYVILEFRDMNIFNGFANSLKELLIEVSPADRGTTFHAIPDAVTRLSALESMFVGAKIHCTCDLAYLKNWRPPFDLHLFYPNCVNSPNTSVLDYIATSMRQC